ncbi:MAG TPA: hypothetical protein VN253_03520 [Kofleriaceae bacterium]|nr:hypothetical protein [Kofleriaceae bacterium]
MTEVLLQELAKLLAGTRGTIAIVWRLVGADRRMHDQDREDIGHDLHGRVVHEERGRWRRSR